MLNIDCLSGEKFLEYRDRVKKSWSFAVTGFTLPLRSICCTTLYKEINKRNYAGKIAAEKLAKRAQSTSKKKRNIEDDED